MDQGPGGDSPKNEVNPDPDRVQRPNYEAVVIEVAMESLPTANSPSFWDFTVVLLLRPLLAIGFVLFLISFGWFLAWKLVLVHVPLVQEIFGLRKKPVQSKPPTRRLSKFYNAINAQKSL
ncbi:uncharacterized protein G2W53_030891 [Senna tora]|uniref:Uncharacterized protein n=1 Tax=Senna tora TaxID=362788 RepID=A0A834WBZ9_9FABA|nr:uncharacterized protein G2W53_030891 [Senna tora]